MKTVPFEDLIQTLRSETVPFSVVWEVTHHCNLKCLHCYQGEAGADLDWSIAASMLDDLAAAGCLKLTLTGGEPTLRPDFAKIYRHCNEKGFAVTLFTNATRFSPEVRRTLLDMPPLAVECSLHGASPAVHDRVTGVSGSFHAAVGNIVWLVENRFHVVMKSVMLGFNHGDLDDLRTMAREWGVSFQPTFRVFPTLDPGRPAGRLRVPDDVLRTRAVNGRRPEPGEEPEPDSDAFICNAGRQACAISAEGKVYPCVALRWECGDLREQAFPEVWRNSPVLHAIRGYREEDFTSCLRCPWKPVCDFCPGMGYGENGDMLVPSTEMCRLTQLTKTLPTGSE